MKNPVKFYKEHKKVLRVKNIKLDHLKLISLEVYFAGRGEYLDLYDVTIPWFRIHLEYRVGGGLLQEYILVHDSSQDSLRVG